MLPVHKNISVGRQSCLQPPFRRLLRSEGAPFTRGNGASVLRRPLHAIDHKMLLRPSSFSPSCCSSAVKIVAPGGISELGSTAHIRAGPKPRVCSSGAYSNRMLNNAVLPGPVDYVFIQDQRQRHRQPQKPTCRRLPPSQPGRAADRIGTLRKSSADIGQTENARSKYTSWRLSQSGRLPRFVLNSTRRSAVDSRHSLMLYLIALRCIAFLDERI